MDLGEQAHRVKFMIRDRGSNFTSAFDAVLADAGIRTVLCNVRTPRMNAIAECWIGGCRRELMDCTLIWNQAHLLRIMRAYEIHHNQHRPHRSLDSAAPLKPLPEPVDLDRYHVRKQAHAACLINEYCLVALRGRGFRHAQRQTQHAPSAQPPSCETTANHAQTPARPQFHPGHRATKWPILSLVCHWLQDLRLACDLRSDHQKGDAARREGLTEPHNTKRIRSKRPRNAWRRSVQARRSVILHLGGISLGDLGFVA